MQQIPSSNLLLLVTDPTCDCSIFPLVLQEATEVKYILLILPILQDMRGEGRVEVKETSLRGSNFEKPRPAFLTTSIPSSPTERHDLFSSPPPHPPTIECCLLTLEAACKAAGPTKDRFFLNLVSRISRIHSCCEVFTLTVNSAHNASVKCERMRSQKLRRRPDSCHAFHPEVRAGGATRGRTWSSSPNPQFWYCANTPADRSASGHLRTQPYTCTSVEYIRVFAFTFGPLCHSNTKSTRSQGCSYKEGQISQGLGPQ